MAKSPLEAFAKFNDLLEKRVKATVELKGFADISEYISTGNYLLNAQLSGSLFGGFPNTRSIGIAGDPGSGKTFLCMNAVRELQNMGYFVFYIDTEGAIDSIDFPKFGANLDQLKYYRMKLITDVKFFVDGLVKQKKESSELKIALFVDSIGLLNSDKEVGDFEKGKSVSDMGLKAKDLRAMFRSFTLDLSNERIPFIFTNHTYSGTDVYSGKTPGGGGGPEFAASIILMLSKGTLKDENKTATGIIVRSRTRKNRLARPIEIEFHISHQKGMNPYVGLQDYISWEACGVGRGKKLTEKEFSKLKPDDQSDCVQFEVGGGTFYFKPGKLAQNYILRHNGDEVPVKQFFTSRLFTDTVLHELDKRVIKPTFKYPETIDALMEEESEEILADEKEVGDEL
jgi:recombination protein RecA